VTSNPTHINLRGDIMAKSKPLIVRSWITENGVTKRYDTLPQEEKDRLSKKMMKNCGRGMSDYYNRQMMLEQGN